MPLRPPKRLPRRLNRQTSKYTQQIVRKRHVAKRTRARKRIFGFAERRMQKLRKTVIAEFKFWLAFLGIALFATTMGILLFSSVFHVKQINVLREDSRIDIEEIQRALAPLFRERLFLVTKGQVSTLLSRFEDVVAVEIEKQYPSSISVSLHLDPLSTRLDVVAPDAEPEETDQAEAASGTGARAGSGMYTYLTTRGHAVLSPVSLTDAPLPVFRLLDWSIKPEHRSRVLDEEFLLTVFKARETLTEHFGLPVSRVDIYLRAREFHLGIGNTSLWFDLASPLADQFERFRQFLKVQPLESVREYIDLRLSDRVVYR